MEVCGTHTVELRKQGIHSLLPKSVMLVSGPGCPVCVTPSGYIDNALALADSGTALIATFGDMMKVPGSAGRSLYSLTGSGWVRLDALAIGWRATANTWATAIDSRRATGRSLSTLGLFRTCSLVSRTRSRR